MAERERLVDQVHKKLRAFGHGHLAARELEGWLDSAAAEIHAEGDPALRSLTDWALSLLAEVHYGYRTEPAVRRTLAALVPACTGDT